MDRYPSKPEQIKNTLMRKINIIEFERHQRQFLNELTVKRIQVEELKKELDTANLKIHELTRALETSKATADELQHNFNLSIKNAKFLEDKLQAKRDSATRTRLQQESMVSEKEHLRELLQKADLQNYNLIRELGELKAQHSCDLAYQKQLLNQDAKIRAKIAELTKAVQNFEADHATITQLQNKIRTGEELEKMVRFYRDEFYKQRQSYAALQEKYIVVNATVEKFQKLSSDNAELFHVQHGARIIMTQWEKATKWFNDHTASQKEVIENLTKTLEAEKETSKKICMLEAELENENRKLLSENEELNKKLNQIIKEHENCKLQENNRIVMEVESRPIKREVIEICEDD